MSDPRSLVDVRSLTVTDQAGNQVLDEVSVVVAAGSGLGVIGPSGAGKTSLALSLLGEVRPGLRHVAGSVEVAGTRPLEMRGRDRRHFRRSQTAWLGQDPAAALTPTMSIAELVTEPLPRRDRTRERATAALAAVGLPIETGFLRRRPHEISGGQRRRVALARALVRNPALMILDEPLAGLDLESRRTVLNELSSVRQRSSTTLMVISHDLSAIAELTDQLIVLDSGRIIERGPTGQTLDFPSSQTATELVVSLRPLPLPTSHPDRIGPVVLSVEALSVAVPGGTPLVEGATFTVAAGEGLAIIGASGAGKTTLARTIIGLSPPHAGGAILHGRDEHRAGRVGFVPQDPATALNPSRTVSAILQQALRRRADPARHTVTGLMRTVGLDPQLAHRRPGALSGGQRQRVAIARALAGSPDLLVCDEPTSALDPAVAASVLDLINRLRETGLAILLISHDLHTLGRVATRVLELRDRTLIPLSAHRLDALTHPRERSLGS